MQDWIQSLKQYHHLNSTLLESPVSSAYFYVQSKKDFPSLAIATNFNLQSTFSESYPVIPINILKLSLHGSDWDTCSFLSPSPWPGDFSL